MGRYVRSIVQCLLTREDVKLTLMSRMGTDIDALNSMLQGTFEFCSWHNTSRVAVDVCWFPVEPRRHHATRGERGDHPRRGGLRLAQNRSGHVFLDNRRAQGQLRQAVARAERVMTVSHFSAERIRHHLGVEVSKNWTSSRRASLFHSTSADPNCALSLTSCTSERRTRGRIFPTCFRRGSVWLRRGRAVSAGCCWWGACLKRGNWIGNLEAWMSFGGYRKVLQRDMP